MPTLMPKDTRDALGANAEKCQSRSLLLDRFVYGHPVMDEARKLHFAQFCADSFSTIRVTREAWLKTTIDPKSKPQEQHEATTFLADTAGQGSRAKSVAASGELKTSSQASFVNSLIVGSPLYAQLLSRLMVNMAGGVMENAGLCLDRFGLPYLSGSAVKGCARRAVLAALREWCEAGGQPAHKPAGDDNLFTAACKEFTTPAAMLTTIARVFGWGEQDWSLRMKDGRYQSDWAWACAGDNALLKSTAEHLATHFRLED